MRRNYIFQMAVWAVAFVLIVVVIRFAHAQEIPQGLSPTQQQEYIAILLYDRIQLLKEKDQLRMQQMDQARIDDAKAKALADYWTKYVAGLNADLIQGKLRKK